MKSTKIILAVLFLCFTTISCIQDEELNAEADITACQLDEAILTKPIEEGDLYNQFDDALGAYPIELPIKDGEDITKLAPKFTLTPGAKINPESGSTHDFSQPVYYTVTSENGLFQRKYAIYPYKHKELPTIFHFEKYKMKNDKYHILFEEMEGDTITWASGNPGFSLAVSSATEYEYPTMLSKDGYKGNCVKMVTRSTGKFGADVGMPIASGNLFLGKFELLNALLDALKATKFGVPFKKKPLSITGYFKYKAGPTFYENGKEVSRKDMFNLYAIFYELKDGTMLDGYIQETNYEHENMVAAAIIKNAHETETWEKFEIEFDYDHYGKTIDPKKLAEGKYYLGIVMAASKDGAKFYGAPGSTLMIDELEVICEKGETK